MALFLRRVTLFHLSPGLTGVVLRGTRTIRNTGVAMARHHCQVATQFLRRWNGWGTDYALLRKADGPFATIAAEASPRGGD